VPIAARAGHSPRPSRIIPRVRRSGPRSGRGAANHARSVAAANAGRMGVLARQPTKAAIRAAAEAQERPWAGEDAHPTPAAHSVRLACRTSGRDRREFERGAWTSGPRTGFARRARERSQAFQRLYAGAPLTCSPPRGRTRFDGRASFALPGGRKGMEETGRGSPFPGARSPWQRSCALPGESTRDYAGPQGGKPAHYMLRWPALDAAAGEARQSPLDSSRCQGVNSRGETGPWSAPATATMRG